MLDVSIVSKIYVRCGYTDMRKGAYGLSLLSSEMLSGSRAYEVVIVYRGKRANTLKIVWWDGHGYCLVTKYLEVRKFPWPNSDSKGYMEITDGQFLMLMEGVEWRHPEPSSAPECAG